MATTYFLNDQPLASAWHIGNSRPNLHAMRSGVRRPNIGVTPELRARLNSAAGINAGINVARDKIKIAMSAACVVLGATGTITALLGFPVSGAMLALTGVFLVKLSEFGTD